MVKVKLSADSKGIFTVHKVIISFLSKSLLSRLLCIPFEFVFLAGLKTIVYPHPLTYYEKESFKSFNTTNAFYFCCTAGRNTILAQ
jgi:hypothetical protein